MVSGWKDTFGTRGRDDQLDICLFFCLLHRGLADLIEFAVVRRPKERNINQVTIKEAELITLGFRNGTDKATSPEVRQKKKMR